MRSCHDPSVDCLSGSFSALKNVQPHWKACHQSQVTLLNSQLPLQLPYSLQQCNHRSRYITLHPTFDWDVYTSHRACCVLLAAQTAAVALARMISP